MDKINPKEVLYHGIYGTHEAYCFRVYDGDTITVLMQLDQVYKVKCRLNGIDTPELRGGSADEKELAIIARDYLRSLVLDKYITLDCHGGDKYGRTLVDITVNDIHVNDKLIQGGYAQRYDGGRKLGW